MQQQQQQQHQQHWGITIDRRRLAPPPLRCSSDAQF